MQLSFVIPTRNQAQFLRQCIDGCIAQHIPDSEVLVVDGASTDATRDVLASYGDRVRWISEPDRGQSDAINKAIRLARGDIVAWINSDDYYAGPGVIARLLGEFARDDRCDIVYGDGMRVDVEGRELGPYRARTIARVATIVTHPASFVLQPTLLFRRALFVEVGGVDEALHYTMDYELWIRMFAAARATRYVPEVIACARYHDSAKSVAGMGKQIRELYRVKRDHARKLALGPVDRARMYAGMASLGAYWLAARLGLKRVA
ncbi:MAG: glycosyltransferase family 2 protein [Kofleriaceae bacterium]